VTDVGRDHVIVSWEPPDSDGNEPLLGYEVEKSAAVGGLTGGAAGTFVSAGYVDAGTLSFRVTRLHEGCDYVLRVSAENRVGLSQPAATERPVTVKLPFGQLFHRLTRSYQVLSGILPGAAAPAGRNRVGEAFG